LHDKAPWAMALQFKNFYGARQNIKWDQRPSFWYVLDLPKIDKS
jgi:hypothetical protein